MKLTLSDGSVWTAHFHHQFLSEEQAADKLYDVVTSCCIHSGNCVHTGENDTCTRASYMGISKCSKKDVFLKAAGRRTALDRALRVNGVDYELRKQLWDAYWQVSPHDSRLKARPGQMRGAHAA